jgi:hypothetical protein
MPNAALRRNQREEVTGVELVNAIVPKDLPTDERWPWKSRTDYMRWLVKGKKTEPHVGLGTRLATEYVRKAKGAGLTIAEAKEALFADPENLMKILRMPITFRPSVRLSLLDAGADLWEEVRKAGAEGSFREINVDRELLRYASVKVYSKTKADGSISAGSGVDQNSSYGLYAWARDGGLVLDKGLDLAFLNQNPTLLDVVERQVRYFVKTQERDGHWQQRYAIHSTELDSAEQRRQQDRMWAEPQKDGTAAVVSALVKYVKLRQTTARSRSGTSW